MNSKQSLSQAPLGKKSDYINQYTPSLLFSIPRKIKRDEIQVPDPLPFSGWDIWNAFEISWLNTKGKPIIALAEFKIPCESPHIIESKSFKLYLNSFNNSKFESYSQVTETLRKDLSQAAEKPVEVTLFKPTALPEIGKLPGLLLDTLDIECNQYMPQPDYLKTTHEDAEETLTSDLLKSNCLVTGQPDWGSILIHYKGKKIQHEGLLKYIVSLRDHNEFHEQCVERIFMDLMRKCHPQHLTVYARYTRRGGLDINPLRTNETGFNIQNKRLCRQ